MKLLILKLIVFNCGISTKVTLLISSESKKTTIYLTHYCSDNIFKSTVVNWDLPSLHEGSL